MLSQSIFFFHAFIGCDSTTSFYRKTKPIFFNNWMSSPQKDTFTTAFHDLSWIPQEEVFAKQLDTIEKFVWSLCIRETLD